MKHTIASRRGGHARARRAPRELDEFHRMHVTLSEVVEAERIHYLEELPYTP